MASTTYLITGANRALRSAKDQSSKLVVLKVDSQDEIDPKRAVAELTTMHNVHSLDVVIANAGISRLWPSIEEARPSDMAEHYAVNVIALVLLFHAALPLLKASKQKPKFVTLGSTAGTLGDMEKWHTPNAVYGPSKAVLNWITKKIHLEHSDIIAFPIDPG
ncbi:hypothetical protein LTR41_011517 [Exophiala xenobiotica]|nr:hypothetical protein LTR41_011517 [Exophiala xenobiotica]